MWNDVNAPKRMGHSSAPDPCPLRPRPAPVETSIKFGCLSSVFICVAALSFCNVRHIVLRSSSYFIALFNSAIPRGLLDFLTSSILKSFLHFISQIVIQAFTYFGRGSSRGAVEVPVLALAALLFVAGAGNGPTGANFPLARERFALNPPPSEYQSNHPFDLPTKAPDKQCRLSSSHSTPSTIYEHTSSILRNPTTHYQINRHILC